jgi:hypothetical protein
VVKDARLSSPERLTDLTNHSWRLSLSGFEGLAEAATFPTILSLQLRVRPTERMKTIVHR